MNTQTIAEEAEQILQDAAVALTSPKVGECLVCFVARQITEFGCNHTHRFTLHYRDQKAPRATSLIPRLSSMGACCCDCEMFLNAYCLRGGSQFVEQPSGEHESGNPESAEPQPLPHCTGVRAASTQPCLNWARVPRGFY